MRPNLWTKFSGDSRPSNNSIDGSSLNTHSGQMSTTSSNLLRNASRRKHKCDVVSVTGSAGLGKTCLVQSIQATAKSHGYFAMAKFDQEKKAPFEPLLKVLSNLFRQVFSESDLSTEFHNNIRTFVNPVWPILHRYFELPFYWGKANRRKAIWISPIGCWNPVPRLRLLSSVMFKWANTTEGNHRLRFIVAAQVTLLPTGCDLEDLIGLQGL